jgi:hypothetical protein
LDQNGSRQTIAQLAKIRPKRTLFYLAINVFCVFYIFVANAFISPFNTQAMQICKVI